MRDVLAKMREISQDAGWLTPMTTASALNLISEHHGAHICNNQIEIVQICVAHFWYKDYKTKERRVSGIIEQPLNVKKVKAVHSQIVIHIAE